MVLKTALLTVAPRQPLHITDLVDGNRTLPEVEGEKVRRVGSTIKEYLRSTRELVSGRLSNLASMVPPHMTDACSPTAFVFPDGILVRYDLKANPELKVFAAVPDGTLSELAPALTESFVHCPSQHDEYDPGDRVITITLTANPVNSSESTVFAKMRLYAVAPLHRLATEALQVDRKRPVPLVSVLKDVNVFVEGIMLPPGETSGRKFVVRSKFPMPVGWEAIEVYPPYNADVWDPKLAHLWAESDLLASVVRRNFQDENLREIDPNVKVRRRMAQLFAEAESLLHGPEEPLHQFIKSNPQLLCPTQVRSWSKLPLGARVTDFVFREASGDYLLVELEKASHTLFRRDGQPGEPLVHAIDQVTDWVRYLEDNLSTVQRELGLDGISPSPRSLVVIGRSISLSDENRRKLMTLANQMPRLRVLTYDELFASSRAAVENILGPLWDPGPNAEIYYLP